MFLQRVLLAASRMAALVPFADAGPELACGECGATPKAAYKVTFMSAVQDCGGAATNVAKMPAAETALQPGTVGLAVEAGRTGRGSHICNF